MRMEEYLNTVTEQIRCKKARNLVSDELKDHILDQAEAYEADGMSEEEAMEKAVREMGDPVETGVSLDRVHRPQMSLSMLVLIGIISILSILVHAVFGTYSEELAASGYGYLKNHIMHTVYGYILMLLVYRLDYSILARYAKLAGAGFLLILLLGVHVFGRVINGATVYIAIGPFMLFLPVICYLFVPLYGGILYQYRGEGYGAFWKLALWAFIPVWCTFKIPSLNRAVTLAAAFAILFSIAVWQGWYRVNRKRVLLVLWSAVLVLPAIFFCFMYMTGRLASYQTERIHAFLSGNSSSYSYQAALMEDALSGSILLGRNEAAISKLGDIPGFNSDFVFVSLISSYGILAGILVAALVVLLIVKIFRISFRQGNQLGMILGCSCGIVFLLQTLICVAMNLGLMPVTSATLPFFSSGGSEIVVSYILLGLVLSVYRYKNILAEKPGKKTAGIAS